MTEVQKNTLKKKIFTGLIIVSAVVYIIVLYLLILRTDRANETMSEYLQHNYSYNLIPFKTIIEYASVLVDGSAVGDAIWNLVGNLLLLFPLGFYLPFFIQKMTEIKVYAIFVAALIIAIEVTQFLTRIGCLDIDDFILNYIGALIGFYVFKIILTRYGLKFYPCRDSIT